MDRLRHFVILGIKAILVFGAIAGFIACMVIFRHQLNFVSGIG